MSDVNVQTLRRHHTVQPFSWNFKRIGISICKPRNYLDNVTLKGKGPRDLDVSAAIASQPG